MFINKLTVNSPWYPPPLKALASPPKVIFHAGAPLNELLAKPRLAVAGSRRVSSYGRQVTTQLARQLAEQGIMIISGLALGVDGLAHQAALEASGGTIAVLPGPLERIYPRSHANLAARIVKEGGALISEYPEDTAVFKQNFIARNRLIAALSQAVLITEASEKSGSRYTADFAREQGKTVLAVPGNITNPGSAGANNLIKEGATAVTACTDVMQALALDYSQGVQRIVRGRNRQEQTVLDLLLSGVNDSEELLRRSTLPTSELNQVLTLLEIQGKIRSLGANLWCLC